ncbi:aryl-alcohol dehydrogenase-like predicted oxidoreductase [Nocardia kruczakiae]|uniref:Aryl-alcohol dehydrogenase-like predicted oxidoreductase n=1 Tax=Nocardia kruczakiae TaxID=261477 RepID=A0ABU1XM39_9NOCA|nr:aldo/keto reductase [Nocardia kruczakiae]MDR7171625.1 aryl-alcohol dehydrogenase-like predicted oxidoreductase [Nocardia kruczakiae]
MGESSSLRRVGSSGLAVSVVGLGTNNFGMKLDLEQSRAVLHAALDHGINLIDTADSYGESERRIGEILQGRRDDVVIATKFGNDVRRLRTDWIDLYQLHRPDPATPIEETLSALDDLVHEGKIRYLGHSNFTGWQTADAEWTARTRNLERFISAQNEYCVRRAEPVRRSCRTRVPSPTGTPRRPHRPPCPSPPPPRGA